MDFIANILMAGGTFGAALYCYVLGQRLKRFSTLEGGMGGAIAVLSAQVDEMTRALEKARAAATHSASSLDGLTERAESVAARLELMLASMHDIPARAPDPRPDPEIEAERRRRFVRRRSLRESSETDA
ncbi:hypothetical protein D1114_05795 [Cereibacter sphaeroides]|uniref:DUF6468 domain-containing protein n=1 Tax=Cereibacter sphaeroides TaxID=1063 RepID=A0AAX1UPF7_CERSP|nr:DUF6468 domain-containing protein [Cereibacter sphaeroides]MWP37203.1 hypothetical protein [Cereibacter sphaeroides]RHZ96973.1 hypothetical protein D1114_05795 [Cereibacter sphaeroides]